MDKQRRALFVLWFSGAPMHGDRALLMKKINLSKGRVTQLLDDDEPFGERAARSLAVKLGLRPGAFEPASSGWPFKALTIEQWDTISQEVRDAAEAGLLSAAHGVRLVKSNDKIDDSDVSGVRSLDAEVTASRESTKNDRRSN